jgi:hypothetical protein
MSGLLCDESCALAGDRRVVEFVVYRELGGTRATRSRRTSVAGAQARFAVRNSSIGWDTLRT